jgi:hypothetical protein
MSRTLHWFNPQNDLALAANMPHYTPRPNASRLAEAGALLPIWYADEGDFVLAPTADSRWAEYMSGLFGLTVQVYHDSHSVSVEKCSPWGWSIDAKSRLADAGLPLSTMPTDEWLVNHRRLSHRRLSIDVSEGLRESMGFELPPAAVECHTSDEAWQAIGKWGGKAYVKSPYSGSGRGVIDASTLPRHQIDNRITGVIARQGSIMVEKGLNKVLDFAMLFKASGTGVELAGYSVFTADNRMAYTGNIIMPDEEIKRSLIGRYVDLSRLNAIESALPPLMSKLLGGQYEGYFGIDMMIYDDNGTMMIAPCVEVNLRMTMGVVAHRLMERVVAPGLHARMRVEHHGLTAYEKANVDGQRLTGGTISLVPPNSHFSITLEIIKSS